MYDNGITLPKIELRSALDAVLWTITFKKEHGITGLELDQQPVYGAEAEMADGTLIKHFRGYRSIISMQFSDRYLTTVFPEPDLVYCLSKDDLGLFCERLRGWDDSGGTIRFYPYRNKTTYTDCIIPSGGFTWTPAVIDGQPKTMTTDYSLQLISKALTQTKW